MKQLFDVFLANKIAFSFQVWIKLDHEIYRDGFFSKLDRLIFSTIEGTDQWFEFYFSSDEGSNPYEDHDICLSIIHIDNVSFLLKNSLKVKI